MTSSVEHGVFRYQVLVILFNKAMSKAATVLKRTDLSIRAADSKKNDHSGYFESLQSKLLKQSEKITTFMSKPTPSETRSFKNCLSKSKRGSNLTQTSCSQQERSFINCSQNEIKCSTLLQKYLDGKKNVLASSKSQYFNIQKEKDGQLQRKLTYNLQVSDDPLPSIQNFGNAEQEKISDQLQKTASTINSSASLLATLEKIKRLSNGSNTTSKSKNVSIKGERIKSKGLLITDFQIIRYLQEGQFGCVYLARHISTQFLCALKKIPKTIFEGDARFINQLSREVKIQSYMDHPNIVQLYGYFSDQEHIYLVLELCWGGNAYNNLKKQGRFQEQKVKTLIKQVSHAVEFMHDNDIIHRDIKPQNILLHEGIAKVCDFGWSIHSPLLRDTRCGTPLYSCPQIIQNQQYDNKIDVWNIGVLTYQLLYGRVPFQIRKEQDLIRVVDEQIYFSRNVPVSCQGKDFILKCLNKNPKDRLSMIRLIDHEFIQS